MKGRMLHKIRERKTEKKGFTLVELIVVMVILAILAAIMVPSLIGWINKARVDKMLLQAQHFQKSVDVAVAEEYARPTDWTGCASGDPYVLITNATTGAITGRPTSYWKSEFSKAFFKRAEEMYDVMNAPGMPTFHAGARVRNGRTQTICYFDDESQTLLTWTRDTNTWTKSQSSDMSWTSLIVGTHTGRIDEMWYNKYGTDASRDKK